MGVIIKQNKKGKYKLISSTSDERLTDKEWVSEQEAKRTLIEMEYWNFIREAIKVSMDFPSNYYINTDLPKATGDEHMKGTRWLVSNWDGEKFKNKFDEICKELGIEIDKIV